MKEKPGYMWIETAPGQGYWSKVKGEQHSHKLDFFCQHCNKITGTVDDVYLSTYGVCWECHTMYISDREIPLIDLSKFKKPQ
jgi:hypothetical protein